MTSNDLFGSESRDDCVPCDDGMESEAGATICHVSSDDDGWIFSDTGSQAAVGVGVIVTVFLILYLYRGKSNKNKTRPTETETRHTIAPAATPTLLEIYEDDEESLRHQPLKTKPLSNRSLDYSEAHAVVVSRAVDQFFNESEGRDQLLPMGGGGRRRGEGSGVCSVKPAYSYVDASPQSDEDSNISWAALEPIYQNGSFEVLHGGFSLVCRAKWVRGRQAALAEDVAVKILKFVNSQEFDILCLCSTPRPPKYK